MKKTIEYDSDDQISACSLRFHDEDGSLAENDLVTPVPNILIDPVSGRAYMIQSWNKIMDWPTNTLRVRSMLIPCDIVKKEQAPKRPVLYFVSKYFHKKTDWVKYNRIPEWSVRHVGSVCDLNGLDGVAFFFSSSASGMNDSVEILDRITALKAMNRAQVFHNENEALDHLKSLGVIT
jgi:hypothetical protein